MLGPHWVAKVKNRLHKVLCDDVGEQVIAGVELGQGLEQLVNVTVADLCEIPAYLGRHHLDGPLLARSFVFVDEFLHLSEVANVQVL